MIFREVARVAIGRVGHTAYFLDAEIKTAGDEA